MKSKRSFSKKQLQEYLNELIALAKTVTSEVETVVQIPGLEEQHAWLEIHVPDEFFDQIDELVIQRAHDIFIETGYDIGAIVHEKPQAQELAAETTLQQ